MTICPWRINWSTETSRELSDSGSIKKRERKYFSQGIYGGEKCFVVVAGGRFIGPKSATPLASCLHGRQGLFPFPITAFPSRFLIRLRSEDFDIFSYYQRKFTKHNFMLIERILIFSTLHRPWYCQYCTLRPDFFRVPLQRHSYS